ncbi:MAG: Holliday junction resolvase RuvX [Parcubacteria group bacterium]|jgi:putative Holliday junction resolvase
MKKLEKYLGLDYGAAKVGLAIADSEVRIAFAYSTIDNDKNFVDVLGKIVELEEIDKIVMGKLGLAGNSQKSFEAEEIGEKIRKELEMDIVYQEEMFSTKMAQSNLKEKGIKKIKKWDNQEAAKIILQGWLDKKRRE